MTLFLVQGKRQRQKLGLDDKTRVLEGLRAELELQRPVALEQHGFRLVAHPPRVRVFELARAIDGLDHVEFEVCDAADHLSIRFRASVAPVLVTASLACVLIVIVLSLGGSSAIGGWGSLLLPPGLVLVRVAWSTLRLGSLADRVLNPQSRWDGPPCPYCDAPLISDRSRQCLNCRTSWHDEDG